MSIMKCPHCGRTYSQQACKPLIPDHVFMIEQGYDGRMMIVDPCPGSGQHPRNAESDRRPLWKDGVK